MNDHAKRIRLHVNIDHVATVRNARGTTYPCPVQAAELAMAAGADGITAHLREDRRHIRDADIAQLRTRIRGTLNLEMAATEEMVAIAIATRPDVVTLVPERREERTTEGGLDVRGGGAVLASHVERLRASGLPVSLFIAPDADQLEASKACGASQVEFHTGEYAHREGPERHAELARISASAAHARALGLDVALGHGITLGNIFPLAAIPAVAEFNIGHALIGEAVFLSLGGAVRAFRFAIDSGSMYSA